jgi:hypothetical protein
MAWIENSCSTCLINGACFTDPDGKMDGYILFTRERSRMELAPWLARGSSPFSLVMGP